MPNIAYNEGVLGRQRRATVAVLPLTPGPLSHKGRYKGCA